MTSTADTPTGMRHPLRPVQYLGSKVRVLDELVQEVQAVHSGGTVWDAFTGSSVVAQAVAASGLRVAASDALMSSAVFATALMGVGRGAALQRSASEILSVSHAVPTPAWAGEWIDRERSAIRRHDGPELLALGEQIPQSWNHQPEEPLSILNTYSGTYFGATQSDSIDRIRVAIETLYPSSLLDDWEKCVALTALCAAASEAVFSAGKHFAQPLRSAGKVNVGFHATRALRDRSVDIDKSFQQWFDRVATTARPACEGHTTFSETSETVSAEDLTRRNVGTVYADPPYTAQQYSRFYHLLETIVAGEVGALDHRNGSTTRGLYPTDRYKSPFCSRRQAPSAFQDLAQSAHSAGANFMLSYSTSDGSTGNARTVGLDELVQIVEDVYTESEVAVRELALRYRKFNHRSTNLKNTADREILLVARYR